MSALHSRKHPHASKPEGQENRGFTCVCRIFDSQFRGCRVFRPNRPESARLAFSNSASDAPLSGPAGSLKRCQWRGGGRPPIKAGTFHKTEGPPPPPFLLGNQPG